MTTATSEGKVENGVNVEALLGAREAVTNAPEAAQFKWRATCKWINGTHSRSSIQSFFGLGEEQKHKAEYTIEADHPEVFASEDKAATPVELVLAGLASCLTAGVAAVAQNRDIQLRSVSATLEAGMDIRGILGADSDVRNGFDGVKVTAWCCSISHSTHRATTSRQTDRTPSPAMRRLRLVLPARSAKGRGSAWSGGSTPTRKR